MLLCTTSDDAMFVYIEYKFEHKSEDGASPYVTIYNQNIVIFKLVEKR